MSEALIGIIAVSGAMCGGCVVGYHGTERGWPLYVTILASFAVSSVFALLWEASNV